jgi:glycosyltransferase involved in cell wall biosynthesis
MRLDSLLVRGPFHGPSGYDHHTREFVRELVRQGVAVRLEDVPEWGPARLPDERRDPWFDTLNRDVGARIALHFTMPHQVVPYPGLLNVNYTMFEATHVHPTWIAHGSTHDRVIVPTESSRDAWIASGLDPGRLRVSPLGIDPARFGGDVSPLDLTLDTGRPVASFRSRFLNISEVSPRKNHAGLLRAWLRATSRHDDAVLILKLGPYSPGWQAFWDQMVVRLEQEGGRRLADAAPICRLHAIYADDEMALLFAAAPDYISI